jgi:hypothetical protein
LKQFNLGDYVEFTQYYDSEDLALDYVGPNSGWGLGEIVERHYSHNRQAWVFAIKRNDSGKTVYARISGINRVFNPDLIDQARDGSYKQIKITPDQLREAFAEALGVRDAKGWKTGEIIIQKIWSKYGNY